MQFHRRGAFKSLELPADCTGSADRAAKGIWKGRFSFRSEQGLVDVHRSSIHGRLVEHGTASCDPPSPEVTTLDGNSGGRGHFRRLSVAEGHQPDAKPTIEAGTGLKKGGVPIRREVFVKGGRNDFSFESDLSKSVVRPPSPFTGKATYHGTPDSGNGAYSSSKGSITGNLRVRFLGADRRVHLAFGSAAMSSFHGARP